MMLTEQDPRWAQLRARDPYAVDEVARSAPNLRTARLVEPDLDHSTPDAAARTTQPEPAASHSAGLTPAQRRERFLPKLKGESQ